jgi:hypothetical protein
VSFGIEAIGADRAAVYLRGIAARARNQTRTFEAEGRRAQRSISGIPVATGRLARGVRGGSESVVRANPAGYTVATTVPYARFVFGGTKYMAARPPRVPTNLASNAASAVSSDLVRR